MSKSLFFQILLTATPAFFCLNLLIFPASFAAENSVLGTEEATAEIAELPLTELVISPIVIEPSKTYINSAITPELTTDIELNERQKPELNSLIIDDAKLALVSE